MDRSEAIKSHLKKYRAVNGLTQKQALPILDVSYATYQALENGVVNTIDVLDKLVEKTGFLITYKSMYDINESSPVSDRERELSDKLINKLEKEIERLTEENKALKKVNPLKKTGTAN